MRMRGGVDTINTLISSFTSIISYNYRTMFFSSFIIWFLQSFIILKFNIPMHRSFIMSWQHTNNLTALRLFLCLYLLSMSTHTCLPQITRIRFHNISCYAFQFRSFSKRRSNLIRMIYRSRMITLWTIKILSNLREIIFHLKWIRLKIPTTTTPIQQMNLNLLLPHII